MSEEKILLVDGNSIINRSFFALAGRGNLTAPDGTPTGAINTYLNTVAKHIKDIEPTHILTLFDRREKTFRHDMFVDYKAQRKGMPDELAVQFPLLKEILDAMNSKRFDLAGFEADDLIGTYSEIARKKGFIVFILSGDKDDFQLIDRDTTVLLPVTKNGKASSENIDVEAFFERYGILPGEFVTVKALMGDPSDNIPGVRGVGEKTALDLVRKYKTLDEIYLHLDEMSDGLKRKLSDDKEMAYLSLELSVIKRDVSVDPDLDRFKIQQPDKVLLSGIFYRLGLRSQMKKFDLEDIAQTQSVKTKAPDAGAENDLQDNSAGKVVIPTELPERIERISPEKLALLLRGFHDKQKNSEVVTIDVSADNHGGFEDPEYRLAVSFSTENVFIVEQSDIDESIQILYKAGFGSEDNLKIVGHSVKTAFKFLPQSLPFLQCFDIEIAGYLLNQIEGTSPSFEMLYEHATGLPYPRIPVAPGSSAKKDTSKSTLLELMIDGSSKELNAGRTEEIVRLSAWKALLMRPVALSQFAEIKKTGISELAYKIEMPLVLHLDRMERVGFLVDQEFLSTLHKTFEGRISSLTESIYTKAGTTFNISSPKQLGQVLFERLGLASGRKSAGGAYSTDSDELSRLINEHPVVEDILTYRQITKLDSTFVVGLQKMIDPSDGRIHSVFSQAMTSTGRLSSAEPNLQNIPIRSELGSLIRKAFIAPKGSLLLDADYSQIELRLLAHLSGDKNMTEAFLSNQDIHINTAASIFHVSKEMVTPKMRSAAKTVNFSIVYGISDFGLAQDLGVPMHEAHGYIEHYYQQYPGIKAYLESHKKAGYDLGYVETMFGRKRVLRELTSPNRNVRMFGERAAMNTPIQGSAADIIKIAMNRVSDDLSQAGIDARLILQVHDELIIECAEADCDVAEKILRNAMETAVSLTIPLTAEVRRGKSWYQCKE